MKKRLVAIFLFLALSIFIGSGFCSAERPETGPGKWLQEVGLVTGYVDGDLKRQKDFRSAILGMRFGFDLKPFTKKMFNFEPKGLLELIYEPFLGGVTSPHSNIELGVPVFFKYAFPLTEKFYPYLQVGIGPYYTSLSTYEQGTQFNFISQGGAGFAYFIRPDLSINIEYRRRHVSNAGIAEPNGGIDSNVYVLGASLYF
ncbi:MAG TPA: acyloxyacyl hydrolase [Candidatus Omnitrophota bacterium]|nr:acyloxyacyl hydrolase [Candidatus Omnitrophota bacterium]